MAKPIIPLVDYEVALLKLASEDLDSNRRAVAKYTEAFQTIQTAINAFVVEKAQKAGDPAPNPVDWVINLETKQIEPVPPSPPKP